MGSAQWATYTAVYSVLLYIYLFLPPVTQNKTPVVQNFYGDKKKVAKFVLEIHQKTKPSRKWGVNCQINAQIGSPELQWDSKLLFCCDYWGRERAGKSPPRTRTRHSREFLVVRARGARVFIHSTDPRGEYKLSEFYFLNNLKGTTVPTSFHLIPPLYSHCAAFAFFLPVGDVIIVDIWIHGWIWTRALQFSWPAATLRDGAVSCWLGWVQVPPGGEGGARRRACRHVIRGRLLGCGRSTRNKQMHFGKFWQIYKSHHWRLIIPSFSMCAAFYCKL